MKLSSINDRSDVVENMVILCQKHTENLFLDNIAIELRRLALLGYDLEKLGKPTKLKDGRTGILIQAFIPDEFNIIGD